MEVDGKSWLILQALQDNARQSLTELAQTVGLSLPAVSERVKRLEEAGVISGYHAAVAPLKAGFALSALVGITVPQPAKKVLLERLAAMAEVQECHHVTGVDSYVFRVLARDVSHLELLVSRLNDLGETRTSIILSTPLSNRPVLPPR
ncbi:Lrp/AsnC family transcriptional regulator [Vogesella indigofera]|uniref:Lrp/AsnC family transcriptional regulator n=1 Tax=Vogesella indigofera TaxID=45465 RepID=A0ABT5I3J6_VOGIN|nr:Lrp/AsnC family transcriptional regulator [Vogesella indigofera]MDC7690753.1 Lrp/AsnC family transcriptional regulator [Vogesella indigofera]